MTDGTTLCPHCATRFRISAAQLTAYGGMVRCGYCREAFDAKPNYRLDQPSPPLDLPIGFTGETEAPAAGKGVAEAAAPVGIEETPTELSQLGAEATPANADDTTAAAIGDTGDADHDTAAPAEHAALPMPEESSTTALPPDAPVADNALDFSAPPPAYTTPADESEAPVAAQDVPGRIEGAIRLVTPDAGAPSFRAIRESENDILLAGYESQPSASETPPPEKRRVWPWVTGGCILVLLLLAQSAYFFRIGLAARLPALKPALVGYCVALGCDVPLPRNAESFSIESSSLNADADHENQVNLDALLRNRASYTQAFPTLSLTLNDMHDKPLASRTILPSDYLPPDEKEASGMTANHELYIQLRMDTGELRPMGYRLELFYPQ